MKSAIGDVFLNLSTQSKGSVVGGGPLPPTPEHPKGRLQHWRFKWAPVDRDGKGLPGSTTSVRCAGMPESAGGWEPFEDARMWRKV